MDFQTCKFVTALKRCAMDNGCNEPPCPMVHECEGALWMLEKAADVIREQSQIIAGLNETIKLYANGGTE